MRTSSHPSFSKSPKSFSKYSVFFIPEPSKGILLKLNLYIFYYFNQVVWPIYYVYAIVLGNQINCFFFTYQIQSAWELNYGIPRLGQLFLAIKLITFLYTSNSKCTLKKITLQCDTMFFKWLKMAKLVVTRVKC